MNVIEEMEKIIADGEDGAHVIVFGRCTMHKSPGRFAKIRSAGGDRTLAMAEGATLMDAMRLTIEKFRNKQAIPVMPGMPGFGGSK